MESPHTNPVLILTTFLLFLAQDLTLITANTGNETDRLALIAFKEGITSDPLNSLSSWNSTQHFCQWQGVICGRRHQRVVVLDLHGRSLVGAISPHIGNLTFLREVRLSNNSLGVVIPQEIGRLSRLTYLDLNQNFIGGSIPINLSYCSELNFVNLVGNQLVGRIPPELGSLAKLSALGLGVNSLTGSIPTSLGNLSSLVRLSLARNNLEGSIPDDLGRLTSLGFFQASVNNLTGLIPPLLYNLSTIYYFAASGNRLGGNLPHDIGLTLPELQALYLGGNQLSGSFPVSLTNASGLTIIDLISNHLKGMVPESLGALKGLVKLNLGFNQLGSSQGNDLSFVTSLANCSGLQTLAVHNNRLKGPLPNSIVNLSTQLSMLALGGNRVSGSIPMGIGNLVNLTLLGMEENLLVGRIPSTVGHLRQLQVLSLSKNMLSGPIPASLGNITSLNQLFLQENELEGDIPQSLSECRHMQLLNLSWNNLKGMIPPQLLTLSSLSISLNLAHNSLTGSLPVQIGSLQSLSELFVSRNRLTGTIPTTLSDCISLERLYMDDNSFEGDIPTLLGNLKGIQELDLSDNNLTGEIPAYLGSLPYLRYLNLSYNDLKGQVPKVGVFTNASAISLLGNNHLCGGMPFLKLPTCPTQVSNNGKGKPHHVKSTILILCPVLSTMLVGSLLFMLWMKKKSKRKPPSMPSEEDKHKKISYSELFRATNGFSPNNLVGVGSYGTVYKGQLDCDQSAIAVKVLKLQQGGASKTFLTECKALRSVRHRNLSKIITLCSSADSNGNDFKALVFRFMNNGSLNEWLHPKESRQHPSRSLDLIQRLDIAIGVACALDYLHHHSPVQMVHCDLKPSNVLLDDDMTAHVGDFGLARILSKNISMDASGAQPTNSLRIKGTIGYIPPEYGMSGKVSREGDVYSYGILLLEMFTGRRPTDPIFEGNMSLYKFVELAFPEQVMDVVDPSLFMQEGVGSIIGTADDARREKNEGMKKMMEDCLVTVIGIGLSCCAELPQERPVMGDVMLELQGAREMAKEKAKGSRKSHRPRNKGE